MRLCFLAALLNPRYKVTQGETRLAVASSCPGVSSRSNYRSFPVRRGLDAPGVGAPICTAQGRPAAGASSLSCALLASTCPRGSAGSGCVPRCPGLRGLHCWNCAPRAAQPPPRSRRLSYSQSPAGQALQPFTALSPRGVAHSPPGRPSSVSAPGTLRASLPLLGSCPRQAPFRPGRLVKLLLLRDWAFLSWRLWQPGP